jgi:MoxR-like ATPase
MDVRQLVTSWRTGRAHTSADGTLAFTPRPTGDLAAKLRAAYGWLSTSAILSPIHDLELGEPVVVGRGGRAASVELAPSSYSSFLLLPLLNLVTSQRLLIVGAPGRGKTTVATLIGLLAGHSSDEMRHAIQHGHPQLTISDLLGSPLPADLLRAQETSQIRVTWRRWLGMRVKVIDEYNRIPTKTQSALLSLMAEGYAEMYEQVLAVPRSAWFLTANDDLGGGTFQVIDALKDRIDLVVRATPYSGRHLDTLVDRVTSGGTVDPHVPADVVFSPEELDAAERELRAVPFPADVRDLLGFFAGQLDFCLRASDRLEYRTKDTLHLAGRRVGHVCTEDCPLDKQISLCTQTENGVSARAYQTIVLTAKALAYFRGAASVGRDDLRQVLPWVLHEKLKVNPQSAFFQKPEHQVLLTDRVTWIRQLFDSAVTQHAAYLPIREPIELLRRDTETRLPAMTAGELRERAARLQDTIAGLLSGHELNGPVHDDLVLLKSLHARVSTRLLRS